ncbi:hypothetical protein F5Y10DRAFT_257452 [Nemania abortiva]|nr:hypothetical protein F5Y10DRAFT_257452 [Nemania abortiva]
MCPQHHIVVFFIAAAAAAAAVAMTMTRDDWASVPLVCPLMLRATFTYACGPLSFNVMVLRMGHTVCEPDLGPSRDGYGIGSPSRLVESRTGPHCFWAGGSYACRFPWFKPGLGCVMVIPDAEDQPPSNIYN